MTNEEMIKEIVQRADDNDLDFMELAKRKGADIEPEHTFDEWYMEDGKVTISWAKKINYFNTIALSLPDLIADAGFMKMYGERWTCPKCGHLIRVNYENPYHCSYLSNDACGKVKLIPHYKHIQQQAITIEDETERIDYLFKMMEEDVNDSNIPNTK
jgi:RNase P subunit RPR2